MHLTTTSVPTKRTSSSRVAVLPAPTDPGVRLQRAAEALCTTVILVVVLLGFAVAGLAGSEAQTSAQALLLSPARALEQAWELVHRIDWSYGLRRAF
ncbi:MAG: hypothetical protein AAGK22_06040 [Acidobacteriota bacterium]